ncbi:AAA family ATPase [Maritalea sp.]|uniref:AAA family ATPase n=1 Tax=Maritalea sp. TaxID=2003361 RepID=UPI003EF4AA9F
MKNLIFKEIWILSKVEKAGINLRLTPNVNLLIGENDVGKSTLIKSFYHCLGADTPQINNSVWKKANAVYCVKIDVGGSEYFVLRDERYFGVFDKNKKLISRHTGISTDDGIANFINPLLGFNIELERHANSQLGLAGPAFYFLPFYVDQDEGWSTTWSSFKGLQQFKDYRKNMIEFHLGVRPQSYYDAKKNDLELREGLSSVEKERLSMQAARDSVRKRKERIQVDLDPVAFREEMEQAVDRYNAIYAEQQEVLMRLKELRNQRNTIDTELDLLRRGISELEADYSYAESPDTPDQIGCPTCGTEFENSFVERFGILDDIDHCHSLVDQWLKKRADASERLSAIESEYAQVSSKMSNVEALLHRSKENITLSELIASEGMKEMVSSLNADIQVLLNKEQGIHNEIESNASDLKLDSKAKKEIVTYYHARMKEYLNSLNVSVLDESDYKTLEKQIKNNALGSDLPRSLLAQYFAFLHTMKKFNGFVSCPLLIDSPFQQEQDATNKDAILNFMLEKRLSDQQMILATVSVENIQDRAALDKVTTVELSNKLSLLSKDQFQTVRNEIEEMHNQTLAAE